MVFVMRLIIFILLSLVRERTQRHLLRESTLSWSIPLQQRWRTYPVFAPRSFLLGQIRWLRKRSQHTVITTRNESKASPSSSEIQALWIRLRGRKRSSPSVFRSTSLQMSKGRQWYIIINSKKNKKRCVLFLSVGPGFYWSQREFGDDANT